MKSVAKDLETHADQLFLFLFLSFVQWPRYVRLQRQKRVLAKRLKVPPTLNQFNLTLDKNTGKENFYLAPCAQITIV